MAEYKRLNWYLQTFEYQVSIDLSTVIHEEIAVQNGG